MRAGSKRKVAPLIRLAKGIVLDIGPGGGEWIGLFDKEKVTKVFLSGERDIILRWMI